MAIHQGKTQCKEKPRQRKATSCETQENESQETHHSAQELFAEAEPSTSTQVDTPASEETSILER